MENFWPLIFSLLIGVFFLIGFGIVRVVKHKKELSIFAVGMAFVVMIGMILFDLIPEIIEMSSALEKSLIATVVMVICFILVGIFLLKILDIFLPHHAHHHTLKEPVHEHNHHMEHVGFITSFSLILHNILEGMSVFILASESLVTGLMTSIAIGCHNLPFGIEIASSMEHTKNTPTKYITLILLVFSSFLGALILFFVGRQLPDALMLIFVCIACGMILYIAFFELLKEIFCYRNEKYVYYGIFVGMLLILVMTFL